MVARVRPDSAGIPPSPAPPAGVNGHSLSGDHARRAEVELTLPPEVRSSLGRFSTLVGQPYQRLEIAALRELSALPTPHWPLVRAETVLDWLEPAEAARLLGELCEDGLIVPAAGGNWRLSEEAQLVAAVCAVLAVQSIEPERLVRVLCAATSLALAAGTEDEPAIAPFLAAVDVLDADFATLLGLIDSGEVRALRSVARQARAHASDLSDLLDRERASLDRLDLTSSAKACLERAPALAARVGALADEVETTFGTPAGELPSGSIAVDKQIVGKLIRDTDLRPLGRLVRDQLPRPPMVVAGRTQCKSALEALEAWLQAPVPEPAPLPQPRHLEIEPIDVVPDFVLVAAEALKWLASSDSPLTKWVVGGTWAQAVARMSAAVEAWSRWGPSGDGTLTAELDPHPLLEPIGHDEIAVASRTVVRDPAGPEDPKEPPPEDLNAPASPASAEDDAEVPAVSSEPEAAEAVAPAPAPDPGESDAGVPVAVPGTDARDLGPSTNDPPEEPRS
jgi:hypothetical protein